MQLRLVIYNHKLNSMKHSLDIAKVNVHKTTDRLLMQKDSV